MRLFKMLLPLLLNITTTPSLSGALSAPSLHDRIKIIFQQYQRGGLASDIGAALSHRDANMRRLERRRVIHAIAGHRHHMALRFQGFHQCQFLRWLDSGKNMGRRNTLGDLLRTHAGNLAAGNDGAALDTPPAVQWPWLCADGRR